uniref:Uncharacterized protein n=1 Tax=Picea sitchensis TaxID=3332 RepID=A9NSW6_PICSI|nr:unknown [Picea sitchensis]
MVCWYLVCYGLTADNRLGGQQRQATAELVWCFQSHRGRESRSVLWEIHRLVLQGKQEEAFFGCDDKFW